MATTSEVNFVRQQGFLDEVPASCGARYRALLFQPRIVGVVIAAALLLQAWFVFLPLGALLWWNAVAPQANPFDLAYNLLVARPSGRPALPPAPPPRRFAQGMAGTFMIGIGLAVLGGVTVVAVVLEVLLVGAFAALLFGRFCVGAYLYHLLRGRSDFAHRTMPWSREERSAPPPLS